MTLARDHKMVEEPKPAELGFFRLELEKSIYWRMDSLKLEQDSESVKTMCFLLFPSSMFTIIVFILFLF
jgi:hypothetical protein